MGGKLKKIVSLFLALLIFMTFTKVNYYVHAEDSVKVYVRVEGTSKEGTICEGQVTLGSGEKADAAITKLLDEKKITYNNSKGYISQISTLKEKDVNGNTGWMYAVRSGNDYIDDSVSYSYALKNGDSVISYFCDYTKIKVANEIKFQPEIPVPGKGIQINFNYNHFDYGLNKSVIDKINNINVTIDGTSYTTDADGKIVINKGLDGGIHHYTLKSYDSDGLPLVLHDKGSFLIDGVNSPNVTVTNKPSTAIYNKDNSNISKDINAEVINTGNFIKSVTGDLWTYVDLSKAGIKADDAFLKDYEKDIKSNGVKDYSNTDLEKLIMAVTALGYSPYDFAGNDLVSELLNRNANDFAINDSIFALIAYKFANIPESYKIKKADLVNSILNKAYTYNKENNLYGWALTKNENDSAPDPDLTGIALNALSPFYDSDSRVKAAADNAVNSLKLMESDSGYLAGKNGITSESLSFAILGLTALGKNPSGVDFTKMKGDITSALLSFKGTNGEFKHALIGDNDEIATEEAYRALIALNNYKEGSRYDFYASSIDASKNNVYDEAENAKASSSSTENKLPQTGSFLDDEMLIVGGLLFIAFGVLLNRKNKLIKNQ